MSLRWRIRRVWFGCTCSSVQLTTRAIAAMTHQLPACRPWSWTVVTQMYGYAPAPNSYVDTRLA